MLLKTLEYGFGGVALGITIALGNPGVLLASPRTLPPTSESVVILADAAVSSTCPEDFTTLMNQLQQALPSYANRAIQRQRLPGRSLRPNSYVLVASRPDFEPLPLMASSPRLNPPDPTLHQAFITTLERHYRINGSNRLQQHHWLFFAQTRRGWRLAMMFSQDQLTDDRTLISPPRETSQGAIASGIRQWLRSC